MWAMGNGVFASGVIDSLVEGLKASVCGDGVRESEKESESDELNKEEFLERWNYGKVVEAIKRIGEDTTGPDYFAISR